MSYKARLFIWQVFIGKTYYIVSLPDGYKVQYHIYESGAIVMKLEESNVLLYSTDSLQAITLNFNGRIWSFQYHSTFIGYHLFYISLKVIRNYMQTIYVYEIMTVK